MNEVFRVIAPALYISNPQHLVDLPVLQRWPHLVSQVSFPVISELADQAFWSTALTLAIVASIESLLSLEAADRIDPYR